MSDHEYPLNQFHRGADSQDTDSDKGFPVPHNRETRNFRDVLPRHQLKWYWNKLKPKQQNQKHAPINQCIIWPTMN